MNANIEETTKICPTCLGFQATQSKDKPKAHDIPGRLWESVGVYIFVIRNITFVLWMTPENSQS